MIYIYALVDPFTDQIRYIGKSVRPQERLTNHCNDTSKTWRTNWIQSVLAKGNKPKLLILETLENNAEWQSVEKEWIAKGRSLGWSLTNCTDGGDGLVNPPEEVRQKMRQTWTGRKHKPESLIKIGLASKGRIHSKESKDAVRQKLIGRVFTPEWKQKISQGVSKLKDSQVKKIKQMLSEGISQYTIADQFGVHQGTISNIKRGKCYKHVTLDNEQK
jgi:predicted XRE-type DNA-binding protein